MVDKNILFLKEKEAKKYFLRNEIYSNIDLPDYFQFSTLLKNIDNKIAGVQLTSLCSNSVKLKDLQDVNYKIINNKNGYYAWRPLQLIHPVLYVDLINCITQKDNWGEIQKRFKEFQQNDKIECVSIPIISSITGKTLKAQQILSWWKNVEQKSIEKSLEYSYVYQTDITDCYGSIYTHSIAWAIMGKDEAKKNRNDHNSLGNKLDSYIQQMCYGQTNGIPQGSGLMDFIAEIILGYADLLLTEKINNSISEYHIIRYRDDYRIFCNNPQDGEKILKYLTEILIDLGLKLNSIKTLFTDDIIEGSIKKDKFYWIEHEHKQNENQKQLLLLYGLSKKYPNSGTLKTQLTHYIKNLEIKPQDDLNILISIITEIAYYNPVTYPLAVAISSRFINKLKYKKDKLLYITKIRNKFSKIPNTGFLDLWLQRLTYKIDPKIKYNEKLCALVEQKKVDIWDSTWIADKDLLNIINNTSIIDIKKLDEMNTEIEEKEVDLFKFNYMAPEDITTIKGA